MRKWSLMFRERLAKGQKISCLQFGSYIIHQLIVSLGCLPHHFFLSASYISLEKGERNSNKEQNRQWILQGSIRLFELVSKQGSCQKSRVISIYLIFCLASWSCYSKCMTVSNFDLPRSKVFLGFNCLFKKWRQKSYISRCLENVGWDF